MFHNLARKWEACLSRVRDCEARLQALEASRDRQRELTPEQRDAYLALGEDLQRVWSHESTLPQLRKRLLRAVLVEIIATIKGREIHLLLHWKGGGHSHLVVPRNRTGEHRWTTDAQTGALIRDLARMLPDELIAGLLNRLGKKTGKGNSWTKTRKSNSASACLRPSISDSVHIHRPFKQLWHLRISTNHLHRPLPAIIVRSE